MVHRYVKSVMRGKGTHWVALVVTIWLVISKNLLVSGVKGKMCDGIGVRHW